MIKFKVKFQRIDGAEGAYDLAICPALTRAHCDMPAMRRHARYGSLANSDLLPNVLQRIRRDLFGESGVIRTDKLPKGVTVTPGFLSVVFIEI